MFYLISFAIGGLLGDVFFHTLPHMSTSHSHDHGHAHTHAEGEHHRDHSEAHGHGHAHSEADMFNNLIIVIGIITFFILEKLTHYYFGGHSHDHSHGHTHP